jgi:hypothetical protein
MLVKGLLGNSDGLKGKKGAQFNPVIGFLRRPV